MNGLFIAGVPMTAMGQATISIKPSAAWSVTGGDDLERLKRLSSGVGWEFDPNAETNDRLKQVGIKSIRCINVEMTGQFGPDGQFVPENPERLLRNLATCREVGAIPHVIIATGLHPDLETKVEKSDASQAGSLMGMTQAGIVGPNDWAKFTNYIEAFFKYVLVDQKFPEAVFEVGNEPDAHGGISSTYPRPASGSRQAYDDYFNIYKAASRAADAFEKKNPELKVRLGGPSLAWPFTFKYGDFNWSERFIRDSKEQNLRLDFIGIHYYGNISSLEGEYQSPFPSFVEMLNITKAARDKYRPGVPVWFTEWGPSYHGTTKPVESAINGDHRGAAWTARFLNVMLQNGVENSIYLITTDIAAQNSAGVWENKDGWGAFFTNPLAFGKPYPRPAFHVFDMISRMEGVRVEATRGNDVINCFATAIKDKGKVTLMVWNYDSQIPEDGALTDSSQATPVVIRIREAGSFFKSKQVSFKRWLVDENTSNVAAELKNGGKPSDLSELQQVDSGNFRILNDMLEVGLTIPPSSVSFVELVPAP